MPGIVINGIVNPPGNNSATDGNNYPPLQGKSLELIVTELHGKYHTQTYRGHTFIGSTAAAGIVVPSSTSVSPTFGLWNPAGSGVIAVPIRHTISVTGATAPSATGSFGWAFTTGAGANIGTAAPLTAFTAVTPVNALVGGAGAVASQVKFTPSAATLTAAPSVLEWVGTSLSSNWIAGAVTPLAPTTPYEYDGTVEIAQGTFASLCYSVSAGSVASVVVSLKWLEIPV